MNILVLCPHLDDEMGVLPFVFYLKKRYAIKKIFFAYFSDCKRSALDLGYEADILIKENIQVLKELEIPLNNVRYFDFDVRSFDEKRQEILDKMIELKKSFCPSIVVLPSSKDVHQDHSCIFREGVRCFKNEASLLGFSYPWNELNSNNNVFFEIDTEICSQVVSILSKYKSQKNRLYMKEDFIKANFIATGIKIGKPMAVGYELIKGRFVL